jgi:ABC-type sugar transport system permease subunit
MKRKKRPVNREITDAYILIAPLIVLLAVFILYPVVSNIFYGFTEWPGFGDPEWVGLDNYKRLFQDSKFWNALKNTGILVLYIPLGLFVPLILSAIMQDGLKGWGFFKAVLYLPTVLGYIILGILFSVFFRETGPLNTWLHTVGLDALAIRWIGTTKTAIHMVGVLFVVWSKIGFGCIYFLAAMSSIDRQLYDAGKIDGAGWWRMFAHITIPSIRFAVQFWIVLLFIEVFARAFGFLFSFTYGGPGFSTWTLEFGIYILGFKNYQMGYGSSWAVILFLFCAFIAVAQIRLIRRADQ